MDTEIYLCDVCRRRSSFVIEWYGLNQYGGNPLVGNEVGVCRDFGHMAKVILGDANVFGCYPDGIVDARELEIEHPCLTEVLKDIFDSRGNPDLLERLCKEGQRVVDSLPIPGQLEFKFMKTAAQSKVL